MNVSREKLEEALNDYATEHNVTWLNLRLRDSSGATVFLASFVRVLNFDQLLNAQPKWIESNALFYVYGHSEEDAWFKLSKLASITL